ncbi:hypothetical protein [Flavobacterium notoginsengisoli]|uniref:hypothetical protein n=1 Tax=Flavobacterium notoginsengisoli TaxID=1478199 RepID=UPI00363F375F
MRILIGLVMVLLFSSCASFSDRVIRQNKVSLKEKDLKKLEGRYELFPDISYDKKGKSQTIKSDEAARNNLNAFVKSRECRYDYSEKYFVDVKILKDNRIQFIAKKDSVNVDGVVVGFKLKKGLFYLDNKYLQRNGIPYIAGGYTNHKTRIGLAKDNGLLVNFAYDNSGAIMFMLAAGSSYNLGYHFKRIQ